MGRYLEPVDAALRTEVATADAGGVSSTGLGGNPGAGWPNGHPRGDTPGDAVNASYAASRAGHAPFRINGVYRVAPEPYEIRECEHYGDWRGTARAGD
jgi:hypothetical protein